MGKRPVDGIKILSLAPKRRHDRFSKKEGKKLFLGFGTRARKRNVWTRWELAAGDKSFFGEGKRNLPKAPRRSIPRKNNNSILADDGNGSFPGGREPDASFVSREFGIPIITKPD